MEQITRKNGRVWTRKDDVGRFLFPAEYLKFRDALNPKQRFSVEFLLNTGARIKEAQNVLVQDCDLVNKRLVLRVTKGKAKKGETAGHGRPRIIPISDKFVRTLRAKIAEKGLKPEDKLPILSNGALNQAYKLAGQKAGIKDYWNISSHTFRKTLECWLMALGVDALPLTAHLGHDIRTAAQHYVSPDIFNWKDKELMREIIGDLYRR